MHAHQIRNGRDRLSDWHVELQQNMPNMVCTPIQVLNQDQRASSDCMVEIAHCMASQTTTWLKQIVIHFLEIVDIRRAGNSNIITPSDPIPFDTHSSS